MTYLLDTNVCIAYLNNRSSSVVQRLRAVSPSEVAVCSVVKAELFYGAIMSSRIHPSSYSFHPFPVVGFGRTQSIRTRGWSG
jgi:predicted nucleic acid-binding protein